MVRNVFWVISNTFINSLNEGHDQGRVKVKVASENDCALNRWILVAFSYISGHSKDIRKREIFLNSSKKCLCD